MGISKEIIKNILDKKEEFINSFEKVDIDIEEDFSRRVLTGFTTLEVKLEKGNVSIYIRAKSDEGYVISIYEDGTILEQHKLHQLEGHAILDNLLRVFGEIKKSREKREKQKELERIIERRERVYNILFKTKNDGK